MNVRETKSSARTMLGDFVGSRDNNFNLIRFLAASAVLFSHSFPLATGDRASEPLRQWGITPGSVAVDTFFLTSGFLVTGSLLARRSVLRFAAARALRIYPALIVAVLLTVLAVGLGFSSLPMPAFFADTDTWRYLARNMTLVSGIEYVLPGAFEGNPWRLMVNASLWTLPFELSMYAALALLWCAATWTNPARSAERMKLAVALACVLIMGSHLVVPLASKSNGIHLAAMFFAGSALFVFRNRVPVHRGLFVALILLVALAAPYAAALPVVLTLALPYLVLFIAYVPKGPVRAFNRLGDYSYGIYIYAWPVQQMTAATIKGIGPWAMAATAFVFTLALAIVSWHLIEKRALALSKKDAQRLTKKPFARTT